MTLQSVKFYQTGTFTVGNRLLEAADRTVQANMRRTNSLNSGHRACQGCGEALGARYAIDTAMDATGGQLIAAGLRARLINQSSSNFLVAGVNNAVLLASEVLKLSVCVAVVLWKKEGLLTMIRSSAVMAVPATMFSVQSLATVFATGLLNASTITVQ